ncbi:MAG: ATP-binding protein [Gammaproteobacteria bacterium]|nr:ATP-binding protein [Gammaproteobacteria bacterium]
MDAEGNRLLNRIVGGAIRMSELIDDLLDFSRIGRTELRRVPIGMTGLAREVLGEISETGSGRNLQVRIADLPPVVADRSMLRQVWVNLLSNAIKYSRQRVPALIEVGGAVEGAEVHFFVRDNGAGFDMQYAGKLFQVFQRLHRDPRLRRYRRRPGHRRPHRAAPRRPGLGRGRAGQGRDLPFHPAAG